MNRVVVTGMGIVSSIGNSKAEVLTALREGISGLTFVPEMAELGLKCCVYGTVKQLDISPIAKRARRTMSLVACYAVIAGLEALQDASLSREDLASSRVGIVVGTCFGGINNVTELEKLFAQGHNLSRAGGTGVVKIMNSTSSSNLAAYLGVKGRACSLSSACSSGVTNIGHAYELIKYGLKDLCICGGAEESTWRQAGVIIDNWGALSSGWNDQPEMASRPYDRDRQGLILSEGAGILVLEPLERAQARGVPIYGEIVGYGIANDGADMYEPTGEGLKIAVSQALTSSGLSSYDISYINPHGAATKIGDAVEVQVIRELFGSASPPVSSTKGLSGHSMAATGAHELIYTLLMLQHNIIIPTVNLAYISQECAGIIHVQSLLHRPLTTVMSWNLGLGGTNGCLIIQKV
ncbi:MAG: hypothetical protein BA863_18205 [Desulfovibrio sp. S3730MH75]|nr:MAG: hypothetical protein BA863_18205 [Desulfovibrio sp. S3730MH75]